jgi:hypothetical protein
VNSSPEIDVEQPVNRLTDFVVAAELSEAVKPLPLLHSTSAYLFRDIVETGQLVPQEDRIFEEKLLYFFYGKPSFFPKTAQTSNLLFNTQVFFVLRPSVITSARRVFPFDSGAFEAGLYARFMNVRMNLLDFQIELDAAHSGGTPFPASAQKIVASIYGSNENYFRSRHREDLSPSMMDFELNAFMELLRSKAGEDFDDRRSVIEIQSTRPINLSRDTLEGIILPNELLSDGRVVAFLDRCGVNDESVLTYNAMRSRPEYYAALATERVGTLLEEKGYF